MKAVETTHKKDFKCPECHRPLKQRRTKTPDDCELICGGCGTTFDICDRQTLDRLKQDQ